MIWSLLFSIGFIVGVLSVTIINFIDYKTMTLQFKKTITENNNLDT